jgi:hypothetical protein
MQIPASLAIAITLTLMFMACKPSGTPSTSGKQATAASKPFKKIVLRDVQGLLGGQDLWIFADGRMVVQIVKSPGSPAGMQRYEMSLTGTALGITADVLDQSHFSTLNIPVKLVVPDTAIATITVEYSDGTSHTVESAVKGDNADFNRVYSHLLGLVHAVGDLHPDFEGKYDWNWQPGQPLK